LTGSALAPQNVAQHLTHVGVIIDDQDGALVSRRMFSPANRNLHTPILSPFFDDLAGFPSSTVD
jgi:hypothetical protein